MGLVEKPGAHNWAGVRRGFSTPGVQLWSGRPATMRHEPGLGTGTVSAFGGRGASGPTWSVGTPTTTDGVASPTAVGSTVGSPGASGVGVATGSAEATAVGSATGAGAATQPAAQTSTTTATTLHLRARPVIV